MQIGKIFYSDKAAYWLTLSFPRKRESKYCVFTAQWMPTFVGMTYYFSNLARPKAALYKK